VSSAVLAVLAASCRRSDLPFSKASDKNSAELIKRWGITSMKNPEYALSIPLSDSTRCISLLQDPKSGKVGKLLLGDVKAGRMILEYTDKGVFGLPQVRYTRPTKGHPGGTSLVDFNLDATFDVLYGLGPKGMGMYISLPSGWVNASAKDGLAKGATTVDGKKKYQFDVTTGKWRPKK